VNHARERRLVPALLRLFALVRINRPDHHIHRAIGPVPAGLVRKTHHLARVGVELGMRRERRRADLPLKVVPPDRLERDRVHRKRRSVFFRGEEHPPPKDYVGITRRPDDAPHALVVRERVAVPPEQGPPRGRLVLISFGMNIALAEVSVAVADPDGGDGAVAVEVDVVLEQGREPVVRLDAEEGPVDVARDGARELEVEDVAFEAGGRVHGSEDVGAREPDLGGVCEAACLRVIVALVCVDFGGEVEDVGHCVC